VSQAKSRLALFLWLAVVCVGALVYIDRDDEAQEAFRVESKVKGSVTNLEKDIDLYSSRLASVGKSVDNLEVAFRPAQTVANVLTVVSNTLPDGAWLTGAAFERGKPLQIRGTALTGDQVTAYTSALAMETRFRDVQLVFANNSEIEGTPVVQFAITIHVVGNLPLIDDKAGRKARK
jgi:Tfp pilus assembly protein PilN